MRPNPLPGLVAFGLAFGILEAAVVVYLRRVVDPGGDLFPRIVIPADLLQLERWREAASLVALATVAGLAAPNFWARFAAFLVVFGVWDIVYYVVLKIVIGWPRQLTDRDLAFLLPVPWYGPIWAPLLVAAIMTICGSVALGRWHRAAKVPIGVQHVAGVTCGGVLVLVSFVRTGPAATDRYPVVLLAAGLAIGLLTFVDLHRRVTDAGQGRSR